MVVGQAVGIVHLHAAVGLEGGQLAVLQADHVLGHTGERHGVGGGIGTVRRAGHDDRGTLTGHDDLARRVGALDGERPGALEARDRVADGGHEVALGGTVPRVLDEVRDDLGVGVGDDGVAVLAQVAAQLLEVLDDAVVHDRDAARAVQVRVRVAVGRGAVGGPAGVGDALRAHQVGRLAALGKHGDAAGALHAMQLPVGGQHLETGRVVPAVLEGRKAVKQELLRLVFSGISYDSAHVIPP